MPVKCVCHPETGKHFYFGRKKPVVASPHLRLSNYLDKAAIPTPPTTCSYNANASQVLAQMYLNDRLGDCVPAEIGKCVGRFTSINGQPTIFTDAQIQAMYSRIGGYVPGNPATDQGCDELTAMNYWQRHGFVTSRHRLLGFAAVNPSDPIEYRIAIWLFANLIYGVGLPDAWISPPPSQSGFLWDIAGQADENNGHCFGSGAYDQNGCEVETWGMTGSITDAAIEAYCGPDSGGALWVGLSQEIINHATGLAPAGFNSQQLLQDLRLLAGQSGTYPSA